MKGDSRVSPAWECQDNVTRVRGALGCGTCPLTSWGENLPLSGTRRNCQRRTKRVVRIVKSKLCLCLFGDNTEIHR